MRLAWALSASKPSLEMKTSPRTLSSRGGFLPRRRSGTDLIVRAYRALDIDLQREVHEDMAANFSAYPNLWGLSRPDPNIDHRRVPNLQSFFRRKGTVLPISEDASAYQPGDLVTWLLPGNLPHIGIVTHPQEPTGEHPLIVHNIGRGPELEDMLFKYPITGHYRYRGSR